jgi:hypothetical protein
LLGTESKAICTITSSLDYDSAIGCRQSKTLKRIEVQVFIKSFFLIGERFGIRRINETWLCKD